MSASLNFALIQDIILLLISSIACFYCYLLNKRLKGLSNLKTGVGASIVSLTRAIKDTSTASQSAKQSTENTVEMLQDLIKRSETASVKMEAELISLQRHVKATVQLNHQLTQKLEGDLPHAIEKAEVVAANLLNIVNGATDYKSSLTVGSARENLYSKHDEHNATKPRPHISLVETPDTRSDIQKQIDALKKAEDLLDLNKLDMNKAEPENIMQSATPPKRERDEIDVLFDDIDALVNAKGVTKKVGFLESKAYHRS